MRTGRHNVRRHVSPMNVMMVHDVTELTMFRPAPTREVPPCLDQVQGSHFHVEPSIMVPGSCRFQNFGLCLHVHSAQIKVVICRVGC